MYIQGSRRGHIFDTQKTFPINNFNAVFEMMNVDILNHVKVTLTGFQSSSQSQLHPSSQPIINQLAVCTLFI
jgi:hypothetical protein